MHVLHAFSSWRPYPVYGSAVCSLASECCVAVVVDAAVRKQKFSNMAKSMDGSGQLFLHDSVGLSISTKVGHQTIDVMKEKIKKGKQNPNRYIYVPSSS